MQETQLARIGQFHSQNELYKDLMREISDHEPGKDLAMMRVRCLNPNPPNRMRGHFCVYIIDALFKCVLR